MRGSPPAWLTPVLLVALAGAVTSCSLSLRGGVNAIGVSSTSPTPFVAGGPPLVEIAWPQSGAAVEVGRTIDVDVRGSDPWPLGIARLELFAGDALVDRVIAAGGAGRASFGAILGWTPSAPGVVTLSAYAYRASGTASAAASISVNVSGDPLPATPTPAPLPTLPSFDPFASSSPTLIPTVTLSPSPAPTPTPPPTPKPTPSPTPAPIGVHIAVWVEYPAEVPEWTVGKRSGLTIHVQNIGQNPVSYVRVTAALAGDSGRARTGALAPGEMTTIVIELTPQIAGDQLLAVQGSLPPGYFDTDPQGNTMAWEQSVLVSPAATAAPTPGESSAP